MKTYVVFRRKEQHIIHAESLVRAIQSVIQSVGGVAADWNCHLLSTYPAHLQARVLRGN